MTNTTLFKHATIVNEGTVFVADLRVNKQRIEQISPTITATPNDHIIDAEGLWLLPGMIDDQVHFREPGLTHKGSIYTESRAAVAGGITSFMEMPNVNPSTTTLDALNDKYEIAAQSAHANYAFYLGATPDNIDEIKRLDPHKHCGVKVFMGASTGDLLVESPQALENIFRDSPTLIVTHCENSPMIKENVDAYAAKGIEQCIHDHPKIRSEAACYASSSYAVDLAKRYNSQLHVLHITTAKELELFQAGPITNKRITAEACVHHLWFTDEDYQRKGNLIKCNPAIKTRADRDALLQAVTSGVIDIIATDHAPHTLSEKLQPYPSAPAGLSLVEHALLSLLDHVHAQRLELTTVVEKTAHNPALRYGIKDRGFIKEGFYADLVLVDPRKQTLASHATSHYHCRWTPFDGHYFKTQVAGTWVNGSLAYDGQKLIPHDAAMALNFSQRA